MKNSDLIFKGGEHYVTSPFGMRVHPITKKLTMHNGVDYGTKGKYLPLYAIADGVVRVSKYNKVVGNYISIGVKIGGKDYRTVYKHMQHLSHLKVGNIVKKGDLVGYTGATGAVTGIHLHFDLISVINGKTKYIDYEKFVFPKEDNMSTETIHIVKKGDTLAKIGRELGIDWEVISDYNNFTKKEANNLKVGQLIKIPKLGDLSDFNDTPTNDTKNDIIKQIEGLFKEIEVHKASIIDKDKKILELTDENKILKNKMSKAIELLDVKGSE